MGRKPKQDAKRKLVVIRLQEVEFNAIQDFASTLDLPISTFIRETILNHLESLNVPTVKYPDNPNQLKIETD